MILFVLLLPVILGFMALSVDVGLIYLTRSRMQTAADAGALAGSQEIDPATTEAIAIDCAVRNGAKGVIVTVNGGVVQIRTEQKIGVLFMQILGMGPPTISANASAKSSRLIE